MVSSTVMLYCFLSIHVLLATIFISLYSLHTNGPKLGPLNEMRSVNVGNAFQALKTDTSLRDPLHLASYLLLLLAKHTNKIVLAAMCLMFSVMKLHSVTLISQCCPGST